MSNDFLIFFEEHPIPSWICDKKTQLIIAVNKAALKTFGVTKKQFLSFTLQELALHERIIAIQQGKPFLIHFRAKQKQQFSVNVICKLFRKKGREMVLMTTQPGTHTVITSDQPDKSADNVTAIQCDNFRKAIENACIISVTDTNGVITYVNENLVRISGFARNELVGHDHALLNSGHHPASFWKRMWNALSSGKSWQGEVKNKNKEGNCYWANTFITPLTGDDGNIKEFLSIAHNITAYKHAEELIRRSNQQLKHALHFGKLASGILTISTGNVMLSPELLRILDIRSSRPMSMNIHDFISQFVLDDYQEALLDKITHGISTLEKGIENTLETEFRVKTAAGKKKILSAKAKFKEDEAFGIVQDVTDSRRTQQEVLNKSRQIENILQGITDGFYAVDQNWNFILVNPQFASLANSKPREMIGKNMWPFFPVLTGPVKEKHLKAMSSRKAVNFETTNPVNPDQYFEVFIYPSAEGLLVYVRDISLRKHEEQKIQELQNNQNRLAMIAERTSNAVLFTDLKGCITWVNKGFERLTEYAFEEIAGMKPGQFLQGPETSLEGIEYMHECLKRKTGFQIELLNYSKTGRRYWVEIEVMPVKGENGSITGFMAIESDITRLKVAVEEMLKSQEQLQTIMDFSPADVFVKDTTGRYLFYNKSFERHFVTIENYLTPTEHTLFPDNATEFIKSDEHVIKTGKPVILEQDLTIKDKAENFITVKFPMQNPEGEVYAIGGVALNITDRKRTEKALHESEERIRMLADNLPTGAIYQNVFDTTTESFRYIYFSSGIEAMTGLKATEIIYDITAFNSLVHEEDLLGLMVTQKHSQETLTVFNYEFRLKNRSGDLRWMRSRSRPRQLENGSIIWDGFLIDMTDKKRVEEKLFQSEARLQNIFQSMINGVVVVDTIGEITYANDSAAKILDLIPEENQHRYYSSHEWRQIDADGNPYPPQKLPLAIALEQQKIATNIEYGIKAPERDVRWLSVSAGPLWDKTGRMIGAVASFIDITRSREAAKALEKSENEMRAILDASSDAIFLLDQHFNILLFNTAAGALLKEFDRAIPATGQSIKKFLPLQVIDLLESGFVRALQGESVQWERRIKVNDRFLWFHVRFIPVYNKQGEVLGVSLNGTDITERKVAEEKLKETSSRLQLATHSAGIGVWQWNIATGQSVWEPEVYKIFDLEADEIPATHEMRISLIHPEDRERALSVIQGCIYENRNYDIEYRIITSLGAVKHISDHGIIQDENGKVVQMTGVIMDVTQQKEYEASLRERESQLRDSVREKEMLIREIHHRVKNNLQLISSIIYLKMISLTETETDFRSFLDNTRQKIKSIALIHEKLLQSEKVNQVEISDYLQKLLAEIKMAQHGPNLDLTIESHIEGGMMLLDTAIYCGLIVNELVTNSIKHAFGDRKSGRICVHYHTIGSVQVLKIEDDGISIQEDFVHSTGSSFGMQMLEVFIKQINGTMKIKRDQGTAFIISF